MHFWIVLGCFWFFSIPSGFFIASAGSLEFGSIVVPLFLFLVSVNTLLVRCVWIDAHDNCMGLVWTDNTNAWLYLWCVLAGSCIDSPFCLRSIRSAQLVSIASELCAGNRICTIAF